jgi:hypothetical protein
MKKTCYKHGTDGKCLWHFNKKILRDNLGNLWVVGRIILKRTLNVYNLKLCIELFWHCLFRASWLKYSFITPNEAHLTHKNIVLHCCYMFRRIFKSKCKNLLKFNRLQDNSNLTTAFMQLVSKYKFFNLWLMNNERESFSVN